MPSPAELARCTADRETFAPAVPRAGSAGEVPMPLVPTVAPSRERDPLTGGRCELAPLPLLGLTNGQVVYVEYAPVTFSTSAGAWH